jgi:hypothetical protein
VSQSRFIGLSRAQWNSIVALLILAALAAQGLVLYRLGQLARQGSEAHAAECSYKADLRLRYRSGLHFLSLTTAERQSEYGAALASIPAATIRTSVSNEKAAMDSLGSLRCG